MTFVQKDDVKITLDNEFKHGFDLPELAPGNVLLMFKVSGKDRSVLHITTDMMAHHVPTTIHLDATFTKPRAWFEVLPGHDFAELGNKITMKLDHPADGQVTVSDVVILYVIHE
jgi:hypothetical protein